MELKAYAKINPSIDVLGERENGYHDVSMIMQSIGLYDVLNFKQIDSGIRICCTHPDIPCDNTNIVYKALELIKSKFNIHSGMEVNIEKSIPTAAGLGGGSTDAAASIIAASRMWNLDMSYEDMMSIGLKVGADVPFCIKGGTSLAEGLGEILTELPSFDGVNIVLAKPDISVSTRDIYQNLKLDEVPARPDMEGLIRAIAGKNITYIADNMVNVLESVTIKLYPVIEDIKRIMVEFGALGSMMSGSGPTVFGIFNTKDEAEKCYNRLRDYIKEVYMVETIN